ncbi:Nse4 C-terminal-domain-containing protein [Clohesyomyces aquaticus]|uniref:Non-structural maintenance of chromosomes element 4 n=1 Tax=Clohesyomyces aquaticus TaxID=1231657 RepID=A0A1Y1Z4I0_9PLEO|nr:Nse4 C-terminal-domain-containing protein [Clohesyomyces aquaticus]
MARLNTQLSATPRSPTIDSLYRDPTPLSHRDAPSSRQEPASSVLSPARSFANSDKENEQPESRDNTPRPAGKGKRPMAASAARLPTPSSNSGSASGATGKRRRTNGYSMADSTPVFQDDEDVDEDDDEDEAAEQEQEEEQQPRRTHDPSDYYDPQQDPEVRRQVKVGMRQNLREMEENRDELTKPGNNLLIDHVMRQNRFMEKVRQTSDAVQDARVLVTASGFAGKKMNACLQGNAGVGIDIDQFVSKCIFFMKSGGKTVEDEGASASTQVRNRRRTAVDDDEDEEESGDGLDWAVLGREACFPFNKRPPVCSFLLGPLSVQKRVRTTQTRRTARSQRQPLGPATRPQELQQSDLKQSENSNLPHLVKGIKSRLVGHIDKGESNIEEELSQYEEDPDEQTFEAACRKHRVYKAPEGEGCVSLFDFAVNPKSFGQTVENLFYISFLIREGSVKVLHDENGLPLLQPCEPHTLQEQREMNLQKHQAVFTMDWPTWKKLIEAFDIKTPLIPHRKPEETTVAAGAWYS